MQMSSIRFYELQYSTAHCITQVVNMEGREMLRGCKMGGGVGVPVGARSRKSLYEQMHKCIYG